MYVYIKLITRSNFFPNFFNNELCMFNEMNSLFIQLLQILINMKPKITWTLLLMQSVDKVKTEELLEVIP